MTFIQTSTYQEVLRPKREASFCLSLFLIIILSKSEVPIEKSGYFIWGQLPRSYWISKRHNVLSFLTLAFEKFKITISPRN